MRFAILALVTVALLTTPAAFSQEAMDSPAALWRGYDPESLPLEVESLRAWEEDGVALQKLRFTGEIQDGVKTRIFAVQGAPVKGKRLPGVLHIHGGGQTASMEWIRYWTRRGYVAVSFDFCGPQPGRTEFTDWGAVTHANMSQAAGGLQVRPTPRESSWFHWAVASRRALTLLSRHPQVNPKRLGIFGVSVGGTLCWMVAGSDPRVRTAAPIYGCGYNHDDRNVRWGMPSLSPDLRLFKRVLTPEAHAPSVRCPVLFLNSTNDFHGPMDYSFDTLRAARGPVRQAFTPRYNHHIEPEQGANLDRWMDWQLKDAVSFPASPQVRITLGDGGVPTAQVRVDQAREVERVEVYYALRDRMPQARFWRTASATRRDKEWRAAVPVMDAAEPLHAFANVHYRSGVCLTSNLLRAVPAQLGPARATLEWTPLLEHGRDGLENWFYTAAYTDPNINWSILKVERGEPGGPCLGLQPDRFGEPMAFTLSSHILNDPQFEGRDGLALTLECRGAFGAEGLTVNLIANDWRPQSRTYSANVGPDELRPGWNRVMLTRDRFKAADGQTLPRWRDAERIELRGRAARSGPPAFRGLRWKEHRDP